MADTRFVGFARTGHLLAILPVLGIAAAVSAATVTVAIDDAQLPGEIITITTTLATDGSEPVVNSVFLEIGWNGALATAVGPVIQDVHLTSGADVVPGGFAWTPGGGACLASTCLILDLLAPVQPAGSAPDPGTVVSTLQLSRGSSPGSLDYHLTLIPGIPGFPELLTTTGVTPTLIFVPEPGAAALVALGLLGLGLAQRSWRRWSCRPARDALRHRLT